MWSRCSARLGGGEGLGRNHCGGGKCFSSCSCVITKFG